MQMLKAVVAFSDRETGSRAPNEVFEVNNEQGKRLLATGQVEAMPASAKETDPEKPQPAKG